MHEEGAKEMVSTQPCAAPMSSVMEVEVVRKSRIQLHRCLLSLRLRSFKASLIWAGGGEAEL